MKITITSTILSIPPYISAAWKNIISLHVEMDKTPPLLVITLSNHTTVTIPNLDRLTVEAIFSAHAEYAQTETEPKTSMSATPEQPIHETTGSIAFPMDFPLGINQIGAALQHNPEESDAADLPPDLIQKISALTRTIGITDPNLIPEPEPHCNCPHCQIARALNAGIASNEQIEEEEIVSDEDLKFRTWDINQTNDKLFIVQNPLDSREHYSVYLGEPIGCTCGQKHCEHIRAVLNS